MQIVLEKIDNEYYSDILLSAEELEQMRFGEMIDSMITLDGKRCFVGVRMRAYNEFHDNLEDRCR